ncbi:MULTISPECIES: hypothetical protein [unclassified Kribbella]
MNRAYDFRCTARSSEVGGGRTVVDDLTLTIRPGRVTGFLGPNGAGNPPR